MTADNIFDGLAGIDPALIIKAAPKEGIKNRKKKTALKWSLIAASLCLVLVSSFVLMSIMNPIGDLNTLTAFVAYSYDLESSKPTPSIFLNATFPDYLNTDYKDGILEVPVGLASVIDYSGEISAAIPEKTVFTIETENIIIDGNSFVYESECDITDPKYQCIDRVGEVTAAPNKHPNHYEFHYFDFSDVKTGDSGEIVFSFTNYYGESHMGGVVRIYYSVKGNIVGFSSHSIEDAKEKAENEYERRYLPFASFPD